MNTLTTAPLALPEIKTVETAYDRFKAKRLKLIAALRSGKLRQITGAVSDPTGGVCFVGAAEKVANE